MSTRPDFETATLEALRQEVPESLEWLFVDGWPDVRWQDGDSADRRVAKGWMVLADRRQDAAPSAEQRGQAELLDAGDLADLALWILDAWIDHEAEPPPISEARHQELKEMANRAAQLAQRMGRGGTDPGGTLGAAPGPGSRSRSGVVLASSRPAGAGPARGGRPRRSPHRNLLRTLAGRASLAGARPCKTCWTPSSKTGRHL